MKKVNLIALTMIIIISICPFAMATPKANSSYTLPGLSYMGTHQTSTSPMNVNDQISLDVSSDSIINVYIMTEMQWNTLQDSGGLTWEYKARFKDVTSVNYIYTIDSSDYYYIVFYNKGLSSVYIEYYISYIPYNPFNPNLPNNPFGYLYSILYVLLFGGIVTAIVVPIGIHNSRKKKRALKRKEQEITDKSYCSNCGSIITGESNYCKNCGNELK